MKETRLVDTLFEKAQQPLGPVTCLGITFENDEARRAYFTEELRKKLRDPEFRKIEGFPIGNDHDILALSDPPYYTACPNPWIAAFIADWDEQKPNQLDGCHYHREPFAADVTEGKNDPIYHAHSYHTKVPHKAIMRYVLHYTQVGDIVFDGFCGTGMTGVATQMCGDREVVMSLGYQVKPDGTILHSDLDDNGRRVWRPFSTLGARRAILTDLSPIATFIANNYSSSDASANFRSIANAFIEHLQKKWAWLYETRHPADGTVGKINYVVWSDVFVCPNCSVELIFFDVAFDRANRKVRDTFNCHTCKATLTKNLVSHAPETYFDVILRTPITQNKQVPALINYSIKGRRFEKRPDSDDIRLLDKARKLLSNSGIQPTPMMHKGGDKWGGIWRAGYHYGITHAHHFYTSRNLLIFTAVPQKYE
ncbi:MAG: DNA methyltransferase [Deltaproteobacteria bacterium]|nr:DNA methyltransferase [Deltaproteobacteria bacterium]